MKIVLLLSLLQWGVEASTPQCSQVVRNMKDCMDREMASWTSLTLYENCLQLCDRSVVSTASPARQRRHIEMSPVDTIRGTHEKHSRRRRRQMEAAKEHHGADSVGTEADTVLNPLENQSPGQTADSPTLKGHNPDGRKVDSQSRRRRRSHRERSRRGLGEVHGVFELMQPYQIPSSLPHVEDPGAFWKRTDRHRVRRTTTHNETCMVAALESCHRRESHKNSMCSAAEDCLRRDFANVDSVKTSFCQHKHAARNKCRIDIPTFDRCFLQIKQQHLTTCACQTMTATGCVNTKMRPLCSADTAIASAALEDDIGDFDEGVDCH